MANFNLQGSYRDMNKLVSKVVPIMNDKELDRLLLSHYKVSLKLSLLLQKPIF